MSAREDEQSQSACLLSLLLVELFVAMVRTGRRVSTPSAYQFLRKSDEKHCKE